jgi:hypothetical protein
MEIDQMEDAKRVNIPLPFKNREYYILKSSL